MGRTWRHVGADGDTWAAQRNAEQWSETRVLRPPDPQRGPDGNMWVADGHTWDAMETRGPQMETPGVQMKTPLSAVQETVRACV